MIDHFSRQQIYSLISESWYSIEKRFKETPILYEPKFRPPATIKGKSRGYDPDSSIRKFGAEPYLQATLFAEINRLQPNSESFALGVEGKKLNGKRPDILAWNPKSDPDQKNPYLMIELKVVGLALFSKSLFKNDMERYHKNENLKNGKSLFFFGCYYEGDSGDIKGKVEEYGSILNCMIKNKELYVESVEPEFKKSVVEGYAFNGHKWLIIDNNDI